MIVLVLYSACIVSSSNVLSAIEAAFRVGVYRLIRYRVRSNNTIALECAHYRLLMIGDFLANSAKRDWRDPQIGCEVMLWDDL